MNARERFRAPRARAAGRGRWARYIVAAVPAALCGHGWAAPAEPQSSVELRRLQHDARRVLAADPGNAAAWAELGRAGLGLNEFDDAVKAFENATAIGMREADPYLSLAMLYASRGRLELALAAFEQGLERDPNDRSARFNYSRVLIALGRPREAVRELERLAATEPGDWETAAALVEARLLAGDRDAAVAAAAGLAADALDGAALVSLGRILTRAGEMETASRVLRKAAELSADDAALWIELSRLRQKAGDSEGAVQAARRAANLRPDMLEAVLSYAEALIGARLHGRALEFLTNLAARFDDRSEFRYTLGVAYFGLSRYLDAAVALGRAVALDPSWDTAHFLLGSSWLASGDSQRAAAAYRAAIAVNPRNPLPFVYLARAYDRSGPDFADLAVEAAERALALDSQNVECRTRLAKGMLEEGNWNEARASLEEIVRSHPDVIKPRILLARAYFRLGKRQEAAAQQDAIRSLHAERQAGDAKRGEAGAPASPGLGLGAREAP